MIDKTNKPNSNTEIRYDEALKQVREEVDHILSKSPHIIRNFTKHLMSSRGKFIRATSVIICAEDPQGFIHQNAIKLAASIEILHLATLVHDDIIDNAGLRRGDITLQKKYGKRTAVICGDYLLCAALKLAASVSNKEDYLKLDLPDYMNKVCLGELNQHINNGNIDLSVYQYLKIISGKTAALFEASFYAGAYFSGCSDAQVKKIKQLGFIIGMIFQLTDDCIDFETTEDEAKKPVQSDYEQGVITLPLIHAFHEMKHLKEKAMESGITRKEINDAVSKTGGLSFTRLVVQKYYKKAKRIIEDLKVTEEKRDNLNEILNKVSRFT